MLPCRGIWFLKRKKSMFDLGTLLSKFFSGSAIVLTVTTRWIRCLRLNLDSSSSYVCIRRNTNVIFASQGFCSRSPLFTLGRLSWNFGSTRSRFLLHAATTICVNQIVVNNRSRKNHVYAVENVNTERSHLHVPKHETVKSTHWSKVMSSL